MTRKYGGGKAGFSIIEIVTAIAVLVILGAVLLSSDTPETLNDRARYDTAADALNRIALAIAGYEPTKQRKSFHQVVGAYPGKLSDLTTAITPSGKNVCNLSYTATNVSSSASAANPFYGSQFLTKGTPIAPGFTVNNTLTLSKAVATSQTNSTNSIVMTLSNVKLRDAQGLDLAVDGVIDGTKGIVQYASVAQPTDVTTVKYIIMVSVTSQTSPTTNC